MIGRLASALRPLLRRVDSLTVDVLEDRLPLWAIVDDHTFVAKDGTISSTLAIKGINRAPGPDDLRARAARFHVLLSPLLSDGMHSLELAYVRCRNRLANQTALRRDRAVEQARVFDLDCSDIIADRRAVQDNDMSAESTLLTVYTSPVPKGGRNRTRATGETGWSDPLSLVRHKSAMTSLCRDLSHNGYSCTLLGIDNSVREIASGLYPLMPCANRSGTGLTVDSIFATERIRILDSGALATPASVITGFDITLAPERLLPFNDLAATLADILPGVSWRCAFKFHANALRKHRWREQFVRLFGFVNREQHYRMCATYDELRRIDGLSDSAVQLQMCFAVWSPMKDAEQHLENVWAFRKTVEQWGNCRADSLTGDPVSTTLASVAGLSPGATAPPAAAPLTQALRIAPIARQCSPWTEGEIIFRTTDGIAWPYQRGSSVQASWVEILVGSSGTGKSVALNHFNLASILDSRNRTPSRMLPKVSVIDIGGSSKSLIDLVREGLPPARHHEAIYVRLKHEPAFAINVFDTPPGCRRPTAAGRDFLINFLSILLDRGGGETPAVLSGMIGGIVDIAYRETNDCRDPKRYSRGEIASVDHALTQSGFGRTDDVTWWQVTDWLFAAGHQQQSRLAQTRAVPVLPDLLTASMTHQIRITYGNDDHEDNPARRFRRAVSEVVRDLPILAMPTRFGLAGARVMVLDLEQVSSGSRDARAMRQTALMAMLARHAIMRDRDIDSDDLVSLASTDVLPSQYHAMHRDALKAMEIEPHQLCMDEFHRLGAIDGARRQVLQDMREGRKRNLRLSLASQSLDDFSGGLLESATSVFVFRTPSPNALKRLARIHSLSEYERQLLASGLTGPGPSGAPLVGLFATKTGLAVQKLILALGLVELWALTSTAEDVHLRTRLCQIMDSSRARRRLARRFPSGTAKPEIDRGAAVCQSETGPLAADADIYASLIQRLQASESRA